VRNDNRQILLAARPVGRPTRENFRLVSQPIPAPGENEVLTQTIWLSLAPYMFWRMRPEKSYAPPVPVDGVMVGATVGRVVMSRHPDFAPGDLVLGGGGWQDFAVQPAEALRKLDPADGPPSLSLSLLGGNGLTAYAGLLEIGRPLPGETVAVAAASGGVGAIVGQIAKIKGARAVGIAGGAKKCAFVTGELGFDACLDHHAPDFATQLAAACPNGIDVYFENVGGAVWDAVLPLLNDFARIPVCGLIAQYTASAPPPGPDRLADLMRLVLSKRYTLRGFIASDYGAIRDEAIAALREWQREGRLHYREDITEGLEKAPEALIAMLDGKNFGKVLVRVSTE
jgi:NADPH-dependent curcumin reductase